MYINTDTGQYPVTERDIKALYHNTSFPAQFTPPAQFQVVFASPRPFCTDFVQIVREIAPILTEKGHYEQAWEVVDVPHTAEEISAYIHGIAAKKLAAINEAKNLALDSGFTFDGVLYDSDSKARLAYLELALKLGQDATYSTPWKASTGQWVTMDAALFAALQPAYEAHIAGCFAWQAAREAEVAAALALEDEGEIRAALAAIPESM